MRRLFAIGCLLTLAGTAWVLSPNAGADPRDWPADKAGMVAELAGEASAILAEEERMLAREADIFLDDRVRTGDTARLTLALGERTTLRLGAASEVQIVDYLVDAGGVIELVGGALRFDRTGPPATEELGIRSAHGLIAVRGTSFFAGELDGVFAVFVERGAVEVSGGGATVALGAGEGTDIAAPGAQPTPVKRWGDGRIARALALVD